MKRACEEVFAEAKVATLRVEGLEAKGRPDEILPDLGSRSVSGGGGSAKPTPRDAIVQALEALPSGNKTINLLSRSITDALSELESELDSELDSDEKHSKYETFKTACFAAIDRARPYLDPLDWNGVLGNLALAILGLGVVYAAAGLINRAVTGDFLFFRPTDRTEALKNNITSQEGLDRPHS